MSLQSDHDARSLNDEQFCETYVEEGIENTEHQEKKKTFSKKGVIAAVVLGLILALYGFLLLMTSSFQTKILFQPSNNNEDYSYPIVYGKKIDDVSKYMSRSGGWREVILNTSDGVTLYNFWIHANSEHTSDTVPTTILYFHGNGDRIVKTKHYNHLTF